MKKLLFVLILFSACSQQKAKLTGPDLLERSITYHDPNDYWDSFKGVFDTKITYANSSVAYRTITLDLSRSYFSITDSTKKVLKTLTVDGSDCSFMLNGATNFTKEEAKEYNLDCETAKRNRDYYTYTLGLPMKLTDPGTIIHEEVSDTTIRGSNFLSLKVSYKEGVGKDLWYFYVNPKNYRMEMYQFYHEESASDGEYIILSDKEVQFKGMKLPVYKEWYMNSDNRYLGKDIIKGIQEI